MKRNILFLAVMGLSFVVGRATKSDSQHSNVAPRYINNDGRSDDLPYSNSVLAGDTLYLAGAIGIDPLTNRPPDSLREEIEIIMDGMKARLERVGMSMDDLVSVQVFCPDLSLYEDFNDVYRTYFKDHFPTRAFIGSGPLLRGGHFEINGIAVKALDK